MTADPIRHLGREVPSVGADRLGAIAASLARSPASWEPLVTFDDERPTIELLLPSTGYDVYVESWGPGHELRLEPGDRTCAVTVVDGALVVTRTDDGLRRADVVREGETVLVHPATGSSIRNLGPARAISIHAVERGVDER